jgi:hypothetical protein
VPHRPIRVDTHWGEVHLSREHSRTEKDRMPSDDHSPLSLSPARVV